MKEILRVGGTCVARRKGWLTTLDARSVLDVGCGCGRHTQYLTRCSANVTAVDNVTALRERWLALGRGCSIRFCCGDARALAFRAGTFTLVVARDTLHHIPDWNGALRELLRVSSRHVLIEEPVDDLRNAAKRRTFAAQGLFLELQREVGYPHERHIAPGVLEGCLRGVADVIALEVTPSDRPVSFDAFFEGYGSFAARSPRETYWLERLASLRESFRGAPLSEEDRILLVGAKR